MRQAGQRDPDDAQRDAEQGGVQFGATDRRRRAARRRRAPGLHQACSRTADQGRRRDICGGDVGKWLSAGKLKPRSAPKNPRCAGDWRAGRKATTEAWRTLSGGKAADEARERSVAALADYLIQRIDPVVAFDLAQAWNVTHCEPSLEESAVAVILERALKDGRHGDR